MPKTQIQEPTLSQLYPMTCDQCGVETKRATLRGNDFVCDKCLEQMDSSK